MPNEQADANIIVKPCESWTQQEEEVCRDVEGIMGSEKLDAVLCVAGGWAGGNAAAKGTCACIQVQKNIKKEDSN